MKATDRRPIWRVVWAVIALLVLPASATAHEELRDGAVALGALR